MEKVKVMLTRLEKVLYRLEAQHACFAWAFDEIKDLPGVVFEIGLGLGRTFNHMRHHMPEREIYAFEREINAYPDCMPQEHEIILGEIAETLPAMAEKFAGRVVLAHSDIGSFDKAMNKQMSELISSALLPCLAPQAIIMSDLPLKVPHTRKLSLPQGARADRYYLYRAV